MSILLAFAPFLAFAVAAKFWSGTIALIVGAAVSAVLLTRDLFGRRTVKILEAGTFLMFAGLGLIAALGLAHWSIFGVRLRVDAGLLAIVLFSMAIGQPFTLQYAREQTPPEVWKASAFFRANVMITAAWALAFAVMVAADAMLAYAPSVPSYVGIGVTVVALYGAYRFTDWYPKQLARRAAAAA